LELFRKNIVIQGQTVIPEASFPGKKQIRPHHFCHSGPFATHISIGILSDTIVKCFFKKICFGEF
jgi:hypothetical protein